MPQGETGQENVRKRAVNIKKGLIQSNNMADSILSFLERRPEAEEQKDNDATIRDPIDELLDIFEGSDLQLEKLHAKLQAIEKQVNRL